ncbi:Asp-tRNA(Asn)/Glu-tRNA(Gln) amidotransferase subunit GatB [Maridesulfovibrio frigidus]|uniref:Asp-tRNA(Asn)/Glu-tRNA(Gln) amidotransferase subunit GatB n=1 Tax=Maridesulfovibrio frigidus TaxID=340956 RepID=UPI0004E0C2C4|nr:Asp-tRNA(Asn)/Glu-tRNA(Gln) amidotransferase subunit GatB [Maridesulfovibrio frigidus]
MVQFETVIGLEVHAQLKTNTKIFCGCSTQFGKEPNENVCEVCSGMPGVLPVLNEKVMEYAAKMGLATNCIINQKSIFARKNYFYPDLPKGYQISQFELPICEHGHLDISYEDKSGEPCKKRIGVTRIHMEEDAGKNIHSVAENASFVDLNRTGVPLIEIVSEPDMRNAEEAVAYLKSLRSILLYLDICDGNLEEGSFRCDVNISVRPFGQEEFGTRAELKNINSFRNVHKAIHYEVARQIDLIEDGEKIIQETRLYDADKGTTHSMRGKADAHDYRYFPDPDLVPLVIADEWLAEWQAAQPELPAERKVRFEEDFKISEDDAGLLTAEKDIADYYEAVLDSYNEPKKVVNWIKGDFMRELNQSEVGLSECKFKPEMMAKLVEMVDKDVISNKIGKDIFNEIFTAGLDPAKFVKDKGLEQNSDSSSLEAAVDKVLADNPTEVEAYKGGKKKLVSFFMGQVMKETKGQANPGIVSKMIQQKLS